ncbi:MAG: 2,3-bisphosphoglycerate-independent phosphoglycerate mutase [Bacteroidales bacterium]|nr:2,3-bisphosphoglycerate-independent phosphoglycerate mutase [Candidatus Colimorpha onthohippi]
MDKALLMILDGWGIGHHDNADVIYNTPTPYWDSLLKEYPHSRLLACGEAVGLPDGQMGNSEVGHLNIGAGRVVYQDLMKINRACADGSLAHNKVLVDAVAHAKANAGCKIHLLGLTSNGGVHSSLDHLFALCDFFKQSQLGGRTFVHCLMDGRDTDPRSGLGFVRQLVDRGEQVATVIGRYYTMDRDKRWDRVREGYDLLVKGIGTPTTDMLQAIEQSYNEGVTDEFIKPVVNKSYDALVAPGDVVIFYNFRNDRAKEITIALTQQDLTDQGMRTIKDLFYCTMTPYDATFKGLHVLFDKENVDNTLGEYVSSKGLKQLHIAETEKYAHVTFFLNGGREQPFEREDRILVPSPKVATYDLQPEMSLPEVGDKLSAALATEQYDWAVVNFANGDMVGHTGVYDAIEKAVRAVDDNLRKVVETAKEHGYSVVIIADHGNADHALNADGSPNTAHSLNPVPCVLIDNSSEKDKHGELQDGILADVAPTVLRLLGLAQPSEMTGKALI